MRQYHRKKRSRGGSRRKPKPATINLLPGVVVSPPWMMVHQVDWPNQPALVNVSGKTIELTQNGVYVVERRCICNERDVRFYTPKVQYR